MNPILIIQIAQAVAQLTTSLAPLVAQARDVLDSNDQAELDAALAEIQRANDELHVDVQRRLRGI
jgi:hypothetical protein